MWSALAGAFGNIASGSANAAVQYGTSKALSKYNYELGQRSLMASPGNYKKGLIAAGINPILASNSPIGSTQGSSGVNPGMDFTEGAVKGNSAKNLNAQTKSNIELQGKQGNAAEASAKASLLNALANMKNAMTNEKRVDNEYQGILSQIDLNTVKQATEKVLQDKHASDAFKAQVESYATWMSAQMSAAEIDYWKRHPDEFDNYMKEQLATPGNANSARDWKKYTDAAKTALDAVDFASSFIPGKKPKIGVRRDNIKYAPGF